jgi:hypothetical protein
VPIDRVRSGADDDAEKAPEGQAAGRPSPLGRPEAESEGLSPRAESRARAHAANESGRQGNDTPAQRPEKRATHDPANRPTDDSRTRTRAEEPNGQATDRESGARDSGASDYQPRGPEADIADNGTKTTADANHRNFVSPVERDEQDDELPGSDGGGPIAKSGAETRDTDPADTSLAEHPGADRSDPSEEEITAFAERGEAGLAELQEKRDLPGHTLEATDTESPEAGRRWRTVAEEQGEVRSFPSADAAKETLGTRPGRQLHHLVEQAQANPERSGFPVERINSTDNLTYIPSDVHDEVSRRYSRKLPHTGGTLRDSLTGQPWQDQYQFGCQEVDRAWARVERHRTLEDSGPEPSWRTVAEQQSEVRSFPSAEAARRELGSRPGKQLHHIVEQVQAAPERSGFPVERINSTDNLTYIPTDVHDEVSRRYSRKLPHTGVTLRDSLTGQPWDKQHECGRNEIDKAWRRIRSSDDG